MLQNFLFVASMRRFSQHTPDHGPVVCLEAPGAHKLRIRPTKRVWRQLPAVSDSLILQAELQEEFMQMPYPFTLNGTHHI